MLYVMKDVFVIMNGEEGVCAFCACWLGVMGLVVMWCGAWAVALLFVTNTVGVQGQSGMLVSLFVMGNALEEKQTCCVGHGVGESRYVD